MKKHIIKYLIIIVLILLVLSPLKLFGLIGILLLGGHLLNLKIDYFYRTLLFFTLFFSFNTIIAAVFFLFKIPININVLLLFYVTMLSYLYIKNTSHIVYPSKSTVSFIVIKILASIIMFAVLILPLFLQDKYTAISIAAYAGDNISHLELLKTVDNNGGYYYKPFTESRNILFGNLSGYPQGLHANIYIIKEAMQPIINVSSNYRFIMLFYIYCSALYISFCWLFVLATKNFIKKGLANSIPGLIMVLFLCTGLFFSLFAFGSQSQIASMLLFLSILAFLSYSKNSKDLVNKQIYILLSLTVLVSISFTWLFLLPVAAITIGIVVLHDNINGFIKKPKKYISFILAAFAILLFCIIQPIIQIMYSDPTKLGIIESGLSLTPSILLTSAFVLIAMCSLFFIKKNTFLLSTSLFTSFLFSILIYVYQFIEVGSARYYLYKSMFITVMIASVIVSIFIGNVFNHYSHQLSRFKTILVLIIIVIISILLVLFNTSTSSLFTQRKSGKFSKELSFVALSQIENKSNNTKTVIAIGSCNRESDYEITRLVGALSAGNSPQRRDLLHYILQPNKESLLKGIKIYQEENPNNLIIVSTDFKIQEYLSNNLDNGTNKITFVDIDFGHIPKTVQSCPEAVK